MDKTRLEGKNCLITGAARGMGAAVAEHYAAQGANVCVADLNLEGCEEVVARIKEKVVPINRYAPSDSTSWSTTPASTSR